MSAHKHSTHMWQKLRERYDKWTLVVVLYDKIYVTRSSSSHTIIVYHRLYGYISYLWPVSNYICYKIASMIGRALTHIHCGNARYFTMCNYYLDIFTVNYNKIYVNVLEHINNNVIKKWKQKKTLSLPYNFLLHYTSSPGTKTM